MTPRSVPGTPRGPVRRFTCDVCGKFADDSRAPICCDRHMREVKGKRR